MPSKIGQHLAEFNDEFVEWLEESLTIRNYVEGAEDERREPTKDLHPDSPVETHGQVDFLDEAQVDVEAYGLSADAGREIMVPDTVLVTAGGDTDANGNYLPWPTEIEDEYGRVYIAKYVKDEGNGRIHIFGSHSTAGDP